MLRTVFIWLLLAFLTQSCMTASRKTLLIAGGCTFGASYGITIINSLSILGEDEEGYGFIPVAGPWLVMDAADEDDSKDFLQGGSAFTAFFTSLPQLIGGALLVTGLLLPFSPSYQEAIKKEEEEGEQNTAPPVEFGVGYQPLRGGGAAVMLGSF